MKSIRQEGWPLAARLESRVQVIAVAGDEGALAEMENHRLGQRFFALRRRTVMAYRLRSG